LISGALTVELVAAVLLTNFEGVVDALSDVRRLLVERAEHRAGVAVEPARRCVADPADRAAGDVADVEQGRRCDLAGDDHQAGGHQRLARHP
jgi:hypothetical protein